MIHFAVNNLPLCTSYLKDEHSIEIFNCLNFMQSSLSPNIKFQCYPNILRRNSCENSPSRCLISSWITSIWLAFSPRPRAFESEMEKSGASCCRKFSWEAFHFYLLIRLIRFSHTCTKISDNLVINTQRIVISRVIYWRQEF